MREGMRERIRERMRASERGSEGERERGREREKERERERERARESARERESRRGPAEVGGEHVIGRHHNAAPPRALSTFHPPQPPRHRAAARGTLEDSLGT